MSADAELISADEKESKRRFFLDILGLESNSDVDQILMSCDWDLDQAVGVYFARHQSESSSVSRQNQHEEPTESMAVPSEVQLLNQDRVTFSPGFLSWLFTPVLQMGIRLKEFSASFLKIFRLFCHSLSFPGVGSDFNTFFRESYGEPHPTFFRGDFDKACQQAKRQRCALLIYIHHAATASKDVIARTIFQNENFLQHITGHPCILWAAHAHQFEASILLRRQYILCNEFPHLSVFIFPSVPEVLVGPRSGWKLVGSIEGAVATVDSAITLLLVANEELQLQHASSSHRQVDMFLSDIRRLYLSWFTVYSSHVGKGFLHCSLDKFLDQTAADASRSLRESQDKAYLDALSKDNDRLIRQQKAEQQASEERQKQAQIEIDRRTAKEKTEKSFLDNRMKIAREFVMREINNCIYSSNNSIRIRVKLLNMTHIERSFSPTAPISDVFQWLETAAIVFGSSATDQSGEAVLRMLSLVNPNDYEKEVSQETVERVCGIVSDPNKRPVLVPESFELFSPPSRKFQRPSTNDDCTVTTLSAADFNTNTLLFLRECSPPK